MSELVLLPSDGEIIDPNGAVSISIPLSAIDPSHPEVPGFLRNEVLKQRHYHNFIRDGVSTGHLRLIKSRGSIPVYKFMLRLLLPTFAGFVFEAATVRALNHNPVGKRQAIAWASKRKNISEEFAKQYKAIGTGLLDTKRQFPAFYAPQDALDVKFIRERFNKITNEYFFDVLEILETHLCAGIQVKAITGNEKAEIIDPLISGKYSRVLTYLKHADGEHSYHACMRILTDMYKAWFIGAEERLKLADSIASPDILGFTPGEIEEYYKYIQIAHRGMVDGNEMFWSAAKMEINFHKNQGGILVPESLGECS